MLLELSCQHELLHMIIRAVLRKPVGLPKSVYAHINLAYNCRGSYIQLSELCISSCMIATKKSPPPTVVVGFKFHHKIEEEFEDTTVFTQLVALCLSSHQLRKRRTQYGHFQSLTIIVGTICNLLVMPKYVHTCMVSV